jgi:hypothetical protein
LGCCCCCCRRKKVVLICFAVAAAETVLETVSKVDVADVCVAASGVDVLEVAEDISAAAAVADVVAAAAVVVDLLLWLMF